VQYSYCTVMKPSCISEHSFYCLNMNAGWYASFPTTLARVWELFFYSLVWLCVVYCRSLRAWLCVTSLLDDKTWWMRSQVVASNRIYVMHWHFTSRAAMRRMPHCATSAAKSTWKNCGLALVPSCSSSQWSLLTTLLVTSVIWRVWQTYEVLFI